MKLNLALSPVALALLSALSSGAFAQAAHEASAAAGADDTPLKQLGTVTINGSRPTSLPTQIPTTIEGVTRQEIERGINATDAEDALKYLPSLLVRKRYIGDYNHAVLSTRASGTGNSARSMVYADGILLSNYLGNGATFAPRWGMVSPEEIERVDVLYGPFSAAYGGNSVGAVVDYMTRMPTRFEAHVKLSLSRQPFELYNTDDNYQGKQLSVSLGNRSGNWSWFADVSRNDSKGQPLTFPARLLSAGVPGNAGVPVSGAVPGQDRTFKDWYLLGAATQYGTVQDHLKAKLAYDFSPTVRASYTFGLWQNTSQGRPSSYLRDAQGRPVYSGTVNIGGRSFTLSPTDFNVSNEDLEHVMHGLTVKSNTRGIFDWEVAASLYDYHKDILRAATVALPGALNGGAGRIVNQGGTGWNTFAAKGVWRPDGIHGAHIAEFGYQREAYTLSSIENAASDWISGAPGARNQAFGGKTEMNSLYAQDTWKFAPRWKTVLGARLERWSAGDGRTSNTTSTVWQGERHDTFVSPKAALAFQASADWVLKASLGRAVRMPTVSELYQGGINAAGTLVNNDPNLKPERSWTTEWSAERKLDNGLLRLTAFGERTTDALYSQTNVLVTPNVTNVQNVGQINTKGLETAYSAADVWLRGLDLSTSATWTDSKIVRNDQFPASVGKWQPRIPEWRASGVASYRAGDQLTLTLAARYSGPQFSTLDNSDPNGFAYQGASKYFTTDVRAHYRITRQWSAALGIDNLNNYQYWNFHPYPQRTYVAELKFDL
ncbi:TonB-dependent receptor [Janthinobacterium agaricidamnosum]|uniref:TonB-dependent Receptor Plug domain protein n=1 Tax=Janthinobacterium agaricidamnosum NBRC 102515 = DSM 9628 TaxID=1349767 RepID=W0V6C3_9BURK|nr:TonB-dependent receptor [Janthinobacterium agaricidamnosum]CDG83150.1 tonB-dependent Receptor Plug domain protein [Janthinobacterium agaricidamnosum NBRC 102515 = DSM 9628]